MSICTVSEGLSPPQHTPTQESSKATAHVAILIDASIITSMFSLTTLLTDRSFKKKKRNSRHRGLFLMLF
jgi:hypothetical protein